MTCIVVVCLVLIPGHMCCFWVTLLVLYILKAVKNQDNEIACISADTEELLQTWCPLDGYAKPPCSLLSATCQNIKSGSAVPMRLIWVRVTSYFSRNSNSTLNFVILELWTNTKGRDRPVEDISTWRHLALLPGVGATSLAVCGFPRELLWRRWCWFLVQLIKKFIVTDYFLD
jgi:hypothetical protein